MASEEDLAASLQRSQSTPEPLFGQPDLELTKFQNSRIQHSSNGKTLKEDSKPNGFPHFMPPSHQTGFGGHRSNSFDLGSGLGPPVNKHRNRLSALGRLFKP